MKITNVEPVRADRYLFVRVHTDAGLTGVGESGAWAFLDAAEAAIRQFARYLVGQDPLRIEHHWNYLYRAYHFRGAALMGAVSALDIALWDIAGKHFGVPVWQLLGGKTREKVRTYYHVKARTTEEMVDGCKSAKQAGFTAVGHLSPFLDEPRSAPFFQTHAQKIGRAAERVRQYREAVGEDVDLCIEIHRRLLPAEAIALAREIEPYRPYFYEDPVKPDNLDAMAQVAANVRIPIATGERLHTIQEFEMLLRRFAVHYVRPDVCMAGGISHSKKIAGLAEAHDAMVVPHNPIGPVSTAACVQIAACIPNFALQEYNQMEESGPKIVVEPLRLEEGYLLVPDKPGIGVELADDIEHRYPPREQSVQARLGVDGSVVDQ
jgi:galactonate dehydratase